MIKIKRVYDKPDKDDGFRVLIDGLWPRGLSKDKAKVDLWLRHIAPTPPLRKWFQHEAKKFPEFSRRYTAELQERLMNIARIRALEKEHGTATLLFGAKDKDHNNAVVVQQVLQGT